MKKLLMVLALFLLVCSNVWGFDGQRKGFVVGGGFGGGINILTEKYESFYGSYSETYGLLAPRVDLKVGYAPHNQYEIFFNLKTFWMGSTGDPFSAYLDGLASVASSYYFKPQGPTFFVNGGLGIADFQVLEEGGMPNKGFGFSVGGGYEFAPHFAVVLDLTYGHHSESGYSLNRLTPSVNFLVTAF